VCASVDGSGLPVLGNAGSAGSALVVMAFAQLAFKVHLLINLWLFVFHGYPLMIVRRNHKGTKSLMVVTIGQIGYS